jgi:hypothetical protein
MVAFIWNLSMLVAKDFAAGEAERKNEEITDASAVYITQIAGNSRCFAGQRLEFAGSLTQP